MIISELPPVLYCKQEYKITALGVFPVNLEREIVSVPVELGQSKVPCSIIRAMIYSLVSAMAASTASVVAALILVFSCLEPKRIVIALVTDARNNSSTSAESAS